MAGPSPIEWTDATFNPIGGCSIHSPGCAPCYAQKLAGTRLKKHPLYAGTTTPNKDGKPVFNGKLTISPDGHPVWEWPLKWRGAKEPRLGPGMASLIFVGDMSDLFHKDRPHTHIDRVFNVMGATEQKRGHIFQLLTKRSDVMASYIGARGYTHWNKCRLGQEAWPARNIWLGFSAERQREFDERWLHLRRLAEQGWTIFVSYEPAIAPLVLPADFLALGKRAQVIAGGMSGHDATPAHPDWFRGVRDQCADADVAFFFKQWGGWQPHKVNPGDDLGGEVRRGTVRIVHPSGRSELEVFEASGGRNTEPCSRYMARVGKKAAGRLLDGFEHNAFPSARG